MAQSVRIRSWTIPLIAAGLLVAIALWVRATLEGSMRNRLEAELTTILDADVTALELWLESQRATAGYLSGDARVEASIRQLVAFARRVGHQPEVLRQSPTSRELRSILEPVVRAYGYYGYFVVDATNRPIAALNEASVGQPASPTVLEYNQRVFQGDTVVTRPVMSENPEVSRGGRPIMFVAAPVRDENGQVVALLAFGIRPEEDFSRILSVARMGESGETYAFDANGLMISNSRFDDDLRAIGLLPDDSTASAVLAVAIRDPGANMLDGFRPSVVRQAQPLTRMAADAVAGNSGVDVDGYRDYRGVPVVGAWTWLPRYGFGVTTEVDVAEAYATRARLRQGFWGLFLLLVTSAIGILLSTHLIDRLRLSVTEARQLGQYKLEKKIGEGGMGKVYRARHALLRRPTAVKLLPTDRASASSIARFEREVRVTSNLTHPNTVAIYDYGRTPEGVFYYAMEYLAGIALNRLVAQDGAQPEARVVHVLKQLCGSLAEAHAAGLIHRDVKPSNIMLCERGGVYDFVKVLDFGLVREVDQTESVAITTADSLTGTPLYLSPEAIQSPSKVDARADLYAAGAVGYYLLVGDHVFKGNTVIEVCGHHLNTPPEPPSVRVGRPMSKDLEAIILSCLEKDRERRPPDARTFLEQLDSLHDVPLWSDADALHWWSENTTRRESEDTWHIEFSSGGGMSPAGTSKISADPALMVEVKHRGENGEAAADD